MAAKIPATGKPIAPALPNNQANQQHVLQNLQIQMQQMQAQINDMQGNAAQIATLKRNIATLKGHIAACEVIIQAYEDIFVTKGVTANEIAQAIYRNWAGKSNSIQTVVRNLLNSV